MHFHRPISRRASLGTLAGLGACAVSPVWAQADKRSSPYRPLTVMQIADMSANQTDVSKDFLVGSRAAWQEINVRGGLNGHPVQHRIVEIDGTPDSLGLALEAAKNQSNILALFGSVGDGLAGLVSKQMARALPGMPHIAPWLHAPSKENANNTFPIFASRKDQIAHAVKSLSTMDVRELGVVYATPAELAANRSTIEQIAHALGLKLRSYGPMADLRQLARTLTPDSPRLLVFLGGTPELFQFTQDIDQQAFQRYIVAMSDVNLQTLSQLGMSKRAVVMATQVVPLVTSSAPIVMSYRDSLGRLYDEPPTPQSLAGYIAARYTFDAMQRMEGSPTRQNLLHAMQRRSTVDLAGFRINLDAQRPSGTYVTQSMVRADGKFVG